MYKLVLVCCTSLLVLSTTVRSDCDLRIRHPSPLFVTHFGFRKIVFEAQNDALTLGDGEWIAAYCNTKINIEYHDISAKILNLTCVSSRMHYEDSEGQLREFSNWIYCTGASHLQMYESSQPLPKCESFSTYGIGSHIESVEQYISAAICYDLDTLSLKYAHYIAYKPGYDTIVLQEPTKHALRGNRLDIDLSKQLDDFKHYFSFMSTEAFTNALNLKKSTESLLQPFDFDYVGLVQDAALATDVKDFGYLFNTMWLRQLRLGNWRLYLNALAERARSVQYAVYTGTHGLISSPIGSTCKGNITLSILSGNLRVDAPAYIWSYVKSLHPHVVQEFVVIANNSPYVESPSSKGFCVDMCDEIDWLKNSDFGKMRRKPMFGYTFCCRPEEVAEIIEHFPVVIFRKPMGIESTNTITTTTQPETATNLDNFI